MADTRVTEGHDELARVLKHQATFAVFDRAGAISAGRGRNRGSTTAEPGSCLASTSASTVSGRCR